MNYLEIILRPEIYVDVIGNWLNALFIFISYYVGFLSYERFKSVKKALLTVIIIILFFSLYPFLSTRAEYSGPFEISDDLRQNKSLYYEEQIKNTVETFLSFIVPALIGIYMRKKEERR